MAPTLKIQQEPREVTSETAAHVDPVYSPRTRTYLLNLDRFAWIRCALKAEASEHAMVRHANRAFSLTTDIGEVHSQFEHHGADILNVFAAR